MFGFAGVVVLVWPELSLDAPDRARLLGYAIGLSGAALSALALLMVRRLNKTERPSAIAFYFVLASMIGGLMTIPFGWIWPDMTTLLFLVAAGIFGDFGHIVDKQVLHLLGRIGASKDDKTHLKQNLDFVEDWFGSFKKSIARNMHDFSYQELALGASQPFFHGVNQQFYIGPASDRTIFQTAMRVSPKDRMNAALYDEMLRISDARLLDLPLAKGAVFRAKKAKANPEELLERELAEYTQRHPI